MSLEAVAHSDTTVRVNYPFGAAGALLPLTPANNYTPTVLLCGGTQASPGQSITPETKASTQCASITLTPQGIAKGWQVSDPMPQGRIMGNFVRSSYVAVLSDRLANLIPCRRS